MVIAMHAAGVNASIPIIMHQEQLTTAQVQWVLTSYLFATTTLLIAFGWVADRVGLKKVLITGLFIMAAASGLVSLSHTFGQLIALRFLEGVAAAMVGSTSLGLLKDTDVHRSGYSIGLQTGMTYAGLSVGPVVATLLASRLGWHSVFLFNAAVVFGATSLAAKIPPKAVQRRPALNYRSPMRTGTVYSALLVEALCYLCVYGVTFLTPIYLVQSHRYGAVQSGLVLACEYSARSLFAVLGGLLCGQWGTAYVRLLGSGLMATILITFAVTRSEWPFISISLLLAAFGAGTGLLVPANSTAILTAVPDGYAGRATGVLATARNFGMTCGAPIAAAVGHTSLSRADQFRYTNTILSFFAALNVVLIASLLFRYSHRRSGFVRLMEGG